VDCGEGTQRQFRKAKLNPGKVNRLLITHWHTDHILGIPGLLSTLALSGYNKTFYIYGPKGTKAQMKSLLNLFKFHKTYKIEVKEVSGKFLETDEFYLEAKSMKHGVACNAYSFVNKGQRRIDKKKLKKSKLPSGPLMKKLKEGKNISYKGKKYSAKNLTFKEDDKKISIVLDTAYNQNAVTLTKGSNVLICESSFLDDLKEKAKENKHLTAKQAAEIAKKSKSKKLILTHISQRYNMKQNEILTEAKKVFKNTSLVKDLDVLTV